MEAPLSPFKGFCVDKGEFIKFLTLYRCLYFGARIFRNVSANCFSVGFCLETITGILLQDCINSKYFFLVHILLESFSIKFGHFNANVNNMLSFPEKIDALLDKLLSEKYSRICGARMNSKIYFFVYGPYSSFLKL